MDKTAYARNYDDGFWKAAGSFGLRKTAGRSFQTYSPSVHGSVFSTDDLRNAAKAVGNLGQGIADNVGNTARALLAGQLPLPWVTVGDRYENRPVTVGKGEPVYVGMAGADYADASDYADKFKNRKFPWQAKDPNSVNTQMFRWFDRAQALRAIDELAKDHPVFAFGESYGGRAMADTVARSDKTVAGLALYDPVAWMGVQAPTNVLTKTINVQPKYWNDSWNPVTNSGRIAQTGGRNPDVEGAERMDWYGPDVTDSEDTQRNWYAKPVTDETDTQASHFRSATGTYKAMKALREEYAKKQGKTDGDLSVPQVGTASAFPMVSYLNAETSQQHP